MRVSHRSNDTPSAHDGVLVKLLVGGQASFKLKLHADSAGSCS